VKELSRRIGSRKYLCFIDLEGTQFSHEIIQIGAVMCKLNAKGRIIKYGKPFSLYVRAKNKVGSVVTKLTGITDSLLKEKGVQFSTSMKEFKKYCGRAFSKCLFIAFGSHDLRMVNQSVMYNLDAPTEITKEIAKNFFDITTVFNEFILDKEGHAYSLTNLCKLFEIQFKGEAHDATFDALNLAYLYDAFLEKDTIVFNEYLKVLARGNHMPSPVAEVIKALANGEDISSDKFKSIVKEAIRQ